MTAACTWCATSDSSGSVVQVVVGPALIGHEAFSSQVQQQLAMLAGVLYHPGLSPSQLQAAIQQSTALLNSSVSEGLSNALLEAMELQTPIIARRCAGNEVVLDYGRFGLLFDTPAQCVECAASLLEDPHLRDMLVTQARKHLHSSFHPGAEQAAYAELVERLLA